MLRVRIIRFNVIYVVALIGKTFRELNNKQGLKRKGMADQPAPQRFRSHQFTGRLSGRDRAERTEEQQEVHATTSRIHTVSL